MANESNKENIKTEDHGKTLANWIFPEYKNYPKTLRWYIGSVILLTLLIIFSLATQSYIFLVIIFLFITIYFFRSKRHPANLNIHIYEDGLSIGDNMFYEWKDIKNFWIIYEPPEVKNLYFDFNAGLRPSISISLENQNPLDIRKILLEYLPEDTSKENESFSDGLSRMMKL